jgi:hypothetical protein
VSFTVKYVINAHPSNKRPWYSIPGKAIRAFKNSGPHVWDSGPMVRGKYTFKKKLQIVEDTKASMIYHAAKKHGVDRKRVREWMQQENKLRKAESNTYWLSGAGRKLTHPELDEELATIVLQERLQKQRVTRSMIVQWAKELASDNSELKFTQGWLESFLNRHNFVLHKATCKPTLSDPEVVERAAKFVHHVKEPVCEHNIHTENIYCLDETVLFFDHSKNTTIHTSGAQHVPVRILISNIIDQVISRRET